MIRYCTEKNSLSSYSIQVKELNILGVFKCGGSYFIHTATPHPLACLRWTILKNPKHGIT